MGRRGPLLLGVAAAIGLAVAVFRGGPVALATPSAHRDPVILLSGVRWKDAERLSQETLEPRFEALKSISELKHSPGAGDWLLEHPEDPQTFAGFVRAHPEKPRRGRNTLVVQPLGELDPAQQRVVALTAEYMHLFFGLPVRVAKAIPASAIPASARRVHPTFGVEQLHTVAAVKLLRPRRPADAFAYVAFTGEDLYPQADWNFVFGQAFPEDRIGIWSLARYGHPGESPEAFKMCLDRTLKVAMHEVTHLLGVDHCQAHECLMNGTNSLTETDRGTQFLCPICLQKLAWSTGVDPLARMTQLKEFYVAHGFDAEAKFAELSLETMSASAPER